MRKRRGSILIEVMASILILSFTGVFAVSSVIKCFKEYDKRVREEKLNIAVNMIAKEIKFNISNEELEEIFCDDNYMSIKYEDDLCEKMLCTHIKDLESGNDIKIEKIDETNMRSNYKIFVDLDNENFDFEQREYEFYKSWWMDEI